MGNGLIDGAITSFFEALKGLLLKMHLNYFLTFAENYCPYNITKLVPFKTRTQIIKSPFLSMRLYKGDYQESNQETHHLDMISILKRLCF